MAFLDNSGDIILDAVLTDTGRLRLAQGDGSFKISKFAIGDDEINYSLYNKSHASGSAYYDLEILQTPVLEAFTNNTSNLKTKLLTISRTNILFMPTLKLNKNDTTNPDNQPASSLMYQRTGATAGGSTDKSDTRFYVAVDEDTYDILSTYITDGGSSNKTAVPTFSGVIKGFGTANEGPYDFVRIDQGMDTNELAPEIGLDSDLLETAYLVEIDYRLGRVKPVNSNAPAAVNFIDDDNIASYYLSNNTYVNRNDMSVPATAKTSDNKRGQNDLLNTDPQVFAGPRGSTMGVRVHASQELNSSTYLFTQIGRSETAAESSTLGLGTTAKDARLTSKTAYFIDSTLRIVGANTGFRLDIPIRYVKIA